MKLNELKEIAKTRGISKVGRSKLLVIRSIQESENNSPCFGAEWRSDCMEHSCMWRKMCLGQ